MASPFSPWGPALGIYAAPQVPVRLPSRAHLVEVPRLPHVDAVLQRLDPSELDKRAQCRFDHAPRLIWPTRSELGEALERPRSFVLWEQLEPADAVVYNEEQHPSG
jgi:hypothetical protein